MANFNGVLLLIKSILLIVLLSLCIYYIINIGNHYVKYKNKIIIKKGNLKRNIFIFIIIAAIIILFVKNPLLTQTLITVLTSIIIAYILNPWVNKIEQKGIKRSMAILVVYFLIILVITILSILVLPKTISELKKLISEMPDIFKSSMEYFDNLNQGLLENNKMLHNFAQQIIVASKKFAIDFQTKFVNNIPDMTFGSGGIVSKFLRLVLIPIITYYFLVDKEKMFKFIKSKIPENEKDDLFKMFKEMDVALSEFIRARIIMAFFVGILTMISLFVLGVDFALIIGIITFLFDIVPYIGPFIGFVPAVLIAFLQSSIKGLWVAIIFLLIQWAENNILGPKILGDSTGMHPLTVLLSLIVGGAVFGVMGMIFAVPLIAMGKILYKYYILRKKNKKRL